MASAPRDIEAVTLRTLLHTVGAPLVGLVTPAGGPDPELRSAALVEAEELRERSIPDADAYLLVGVRESGLAELLPLVPRGAVAFIKLGAGFDPRDHEKTIRDARARNVRVVRVHHEAGWDQLNSIVQRLLTHPSPEQRTASDGIGDLFALAETIAGQVHGLVTIEEMGGEVLAYSQATEGADELRISSILGRRGPADQMRRLSDEGVLSALEREGGVLRVPATESPRRAARLAVGIHHNGEHLGNIWVQRGSVDFAPAADALLPGAARLAADLMRGRGSVIPREDRLVLASLGIGPERVEPTVAENYALAALVNPRPGESIAVIGFDLAPDRGVDAAEMTRFLRLHAASYRRPIALAAQGERLFAVVATASLDHLQGWARGALEDAAIRFGPGLRAAIAETPEGMPTLPIARRNVEYLLDTMRRDPERYPSVASLKELRSEVLLGEIIGWVNDSPRLRDPRLDTLREHDLRHDGELIASVRAYLDAFSDVRSAAEVLSVHPNTLRYRLGRATAISGLDLGDPATRIVLSLLLRVTDYRPESGSSRPSSG